MATLKAVDPLPEADHARLFSSLPAKLLILRPDGPRFTIVTATDDYLQATGTQLEAIVGRGLFDVFPEQADTPRGTGPARMRAST